MVVVAVFWQVGRALAAGAATPATTAKPANNTAPFTKPVSYTHLTLPTIYSV